MLNNRRVLLAAMITSMALPGQAMAQTFPSRPITFVVPAAPGGILDQSARLVASELTKTIGQPVVVENRAGASQIIGAQHVVKSEPDGHTLLMGSIGPNAAHYGIYPKLPYKPEDFTPVAHVISMPNVLLVNPSVQATTVAELVGLARARPGQLVLASSGTATSGHLGAELLKMRAGIDLNHVPYKGSTPALTDLIGGNAQVMVDNLVTAAPQIKAGRVRHLGDPALHQQVELAVSRRVGQAWALDRRDSPIDISGLVAVTEALWVLDELVGSADYDVSASVA